LFFITGFFIWYTIHASKIVEGRSEAIIFSIRADNEPLREVLKRISAASGYKIRFNTQLIDERVNIRLENVTLNEALERVLQPFNHMSLWDDANQIVTLLIFKKHSLPFTASGINRIFELATETTAGP
jgi:type II secretory pathway component GspD/PulD (secretin)